MEPLCSHQPLSCRDGWAIDHADAQFLIRLNCHRCRGPCAIPDVLNAKDIANPGSGERAAEVRRIGYGRAIDGKDDVTIDKTGLPKAAIRDTEREPSRRARVTA
jgi:hypothetical protein